MADAQLGSEYRSWILRHAQQGYAVSSTDRDHIELSDAKAKAFVTFYELDENEPEIVELRIQRVDCDCEDLFFLHFELEDEARAEELFGEMLEVFDQQGRGQTVRVLLDVLGPSPTEQSMLPSSLRRRLGIAARRSWLPTLVRSSSRSPRRSSVPTMRQPRSTSF